MTTDNTHKHVDTTTTPPKPAAFYCNCGNPLLSLGGIVRCDKCGLLWTTSVMCIGPNEGNG